jgi:hypothetical protein
MGKDRNTFRVARFVFDARGCTKKAEGGALRREAGDTYLSADRITKPPLFRSGNSFPI